MKVKLTLDEVRELLGKTDGGLHAKLQAALDAAPIETYEEGTCVRCGKTVTRSPDAQRWTDEYGRDRCRADEDDDQCDVREIAHLSREGYWWPASAEVTLYGPNAEGETTVVFSQSVPAGTRFDGTLPEPLTVHSVRLEGHPERNGASTPR